jgi:predicted metal-binding protein
MKTPPKEYERFTKRALEMGAVAAKTIPARSVFTGEWVRMKCTHGCGGYGTSLRCPPHSPPPETTRRMLDEYEWAILIEGGRREPKRIAAALEREAFLAGYYKAFGMGSGPCRLCDECAFDEGCRHPYESRPSMEACGIDVYATVNAHGFGLEVVKDRKSRPRFFGLVLIE